MHSHSLPLLALAMGSMTGVCFGASPWAKPGFDRWVRLSQSTRSMVVARRGIVSTSQPLAAEAGVSILRAGGNAFDAAIATAAVLNVVEPMSTGVGGDVFVLGHDAKSKTLFGLNGSGRSSRHATLEHYRRDGRRRIPSDHIDSVTVPGAVDAWYTLHQKYGRLDWKKGDGPGHLLCKGGVPGQRGDRRRMGDHFRGQRESSRFRGELPSQRTSAQTRGDLSSSGIGGNVDRRCESRKRWVFTAGKWAKKSLRFSRSTAA